MTLWALRKNEETRLDAFEMNGLKRMLRVSWTAKKTNEWVLNKAGVKQLGTVRHRQNKEAGILWLHLEETRELPGERGRLNRLMQGTMPGARMRGRPRTA